MSEDESELTELSSELTELSDNPETNRDLTAAASVHSSSSTPARARTLSDRASSPVPRPRVLGHRSTTFPHPPPRDVWTDNDATLVENDEEMGYADDEEESDEAPLAQKTPAKRRLIVLSDEEDDPVVSPTRSKKPRLEAISSTPRTARARKNANESDSPLKNRGVRRAARAPERRRATVGDQDEETDPQSTSEETDCFKFTYKPAFPFADPAMFEDVVLRKTANFAMLQKVAQLPQCEATNAIREVFEETTPRDLALWKVARTPLLFARALGQYYQGLDTPADWSQCPKAEGINAPGVYFIPVFKPERGGSDAFDDDDLELDGESAEGASDLEIDFDSNHGADNEHPDVSHTAPNPTGVPRRLVMEVVVPTLEYLNELRKRGQDAEIGPDDEDLTGQSEDDLYANVIGEDVDEDVPLAQDMDDELRERTRSAEVDDQILDHDEEDGDEGAESLGQALDEVCAMLHERKSPLSADEFDYCRAVLAAAYAGMTKKGYSSKNKTTRIAAGCMKLGLAARHKDHVSGSRRGKGMFVYRDENGIAHNPWEMLASTILKNGDFGAIDPDRGFSDENVRIVVGETAINTERGLNALLLIMEAECMTDLGTLNDLSTRPWLSEMLRNLPHTRIGVAAHGLNMEHGMRVRRADEGGDAVIEAFRREMLERQASRLVNLLLGTYTTHLKHVVRSQYRGETMSALVYDTAIFAEFNSPLDFYSWTRACTAKIALDPHPFMFGCWSCTATSIDDGPPLQSQTHVKHSRIANVFGRNMSALTELRQNPPSWLESLLRENPGLNEKITDLLTTTTSPEEVRVCNTALLLAGEYLVPHIPTHDDSRGSLISRIKLFGEHISFQRWQDPRPASLLLTEQPGHVSRWKIVATAKGGGAPLQAECSLADNRTRSFLDGFNKLKEYHANNHPGLAKIIAKSPGLAERITSLPTDLPSKEAAYARSMALLVAGKFPRPNPDARNISRFGLQMCFGAWDVSRSGDLQLVPIGRSNPRWTVVSTANDGGKSLVVTCGGLSPSTSKWCKTWRASCKKLQKACESPEPGLAKILADNPDLEAKINGLPIG